MEAYNTNNTFKNQQNIKALYNPQALVSFSEKFLTKDYRINIDRYRAIAPQKIKNCINDIDGFLKSKDELLSLTDIVWHNEKIAYNIKDLYYKTGSITQDDYEKLLKFGLVLTLRALYKGGLASFNSLETDIAEFSKELAKVLVSKRFKLNDPNTWIDKYQLQEEIREELSNFINSLVSIPKYDEYWYKNNILERALSRDISSGINEFFNQGKVKNTLQNAINNCQDKNIIEIAKSYLQE